MVTGAESAFDKSVHSTKIIADPHHRINKVATIDRPKSVKTLGLSSGAGGWSIVRWMRVDSGMRSRMYLGEEPNKADENRRLNKIRR